MISMKVVIKNFHERLRKLSLMFFSEIQIMKDVCNKSKNRQVLIYEGCIIRNFKSDSLGVKKIINYDQNFGLTFFGLLTRCFFRRYRHVPKGCQFRKSGRKFDQVAKTSAIFRSFKRN